MRSGIEQPFWHSLFYENKMRAGAFGDAARLAFEMLISLGDALGVWNGWFPWPRCRPTVVSMRRFLISGPILGRHLYEIELPPVTVDPESFGLLQTGQYARVDTERGEI